MRMLLRLAMLEQPASHLSIHHVRQSLGFFVVHLQVSLHDLHQLFSLGARVGLLSQQTVSKSQGNGKRTQLITHLASTNHIYNLLNQFPCNLPSSVFTWFVCSLLGHVTTVSPLGKPQKNSQFTK